MTNMEHYRAEIEAIKDCRFAIKDGEVVPCAGTLCSSCDLWVDKGLDAHCGRVKWLMAECKEPVTLTAKEKHLAECLCGGFMARDENGALFWYQEKPLKGWTTWERQPGTAYCKLWRAMFGDPFPFIKWEDKEPWSVEELRKLPALEYNPEDVAFKGGVE